MFSFVRNSVSWTFRDKVRACHVTCARVTRRAFFNHAFGEAAFLKIALPYQERNRSCVASETTFTLLVKSMRN